MVELDYCESYSTEDRDTASAGVGCSDCFRIDFHLPVDRGTSLLLGTTTLNRRSYAEKAPPGDLVEPQSREGVSVREANRTSSVWHGESRL